MEKKGIKNLSYSINKKNMIKNMTGMNDPAFQSNKTLKKYINRKLSVYLEKKIGLFQKTKTFSKFNETIKSIINSNSNNKLENKTHQYPSKNKTNNNASNISSNSLNKNRINKMCKKSKSNSCIIFKYNNKSLSKKMIKRMDSSISLYVNDNINLSKGNNTVSNKTAINNIKNKESITTPINDIMKTKSIFNSKLTNLNRIVGYEEVNAKHIIKKNKSNENMKRNQKLNKDNNHKTPMAKHSFNQTTLFKKEINNNSNKKQRNSKDYQLKKTYLREESKTSLNQNVKKIRYKNNDLLINNKENDRNAANENVRLREKIKDFLKTDESDFENKCPVPMPYVKRYTEYVINDNKINAYFNLDSFLINKDLKEPEEQKNIPLPTSQKIKSKIFYY
jgi:hypothetical protein